MEKADNGGADIKDHLPAYLISIHPGSRAIYLIMIFLIIIILASLPLISVYVSVSGRGIIRPLQEKTRITATTSGIVATVFVNEGEKIQKSQPLVEIRSIETQKNLESLHTELQEAKVHFEDLARLIAYPLASPRSPRYTREHEEYLNNIEYLELLHAKADRELARHRGLFDAGLISEKEYEDLVFASEKAMKELENFKIQSLNNWQDEYQRQLDRMRALQTQIRNMEKEIRLTTIHAPATGSMVEFSGIFEGSAVQAGSLLGILSPESELIGEFYISSRNIAFLELGQEVQLHLDAFNARDWDIIHGQIYEISNDFLLLDKQPVYRVKCHFEREELNLRNGFTAKIKKGMTFQAQCLVIRRTLFQLLADKAENWLNPVLNVQELSIQQ